MDMKSVRGIKPQEVLTTGIKLRLALNDKGDTLSTNDEIYEGKGKDGTDLIITKYTLHGVDEEEQERQVRYLTKNQFAELAKAWGDSVNWEDNIVLVTAVNEKSKKDGKEYPRIVLAPLEEAVSA